MKIACIGGGPAGLYLGILVKRVAPEHEVVVYERNRPADTFGFGVVFSDATLGHLAAADPETHRQITTEFARWDDIEIHAGGEVLRSTGHGFCGLERKTLLQILQARAQELGVRDRVRARDQARSTRACATADVIVACDGVASWVRDALAAELRPHVDVRPNKFVWLGCTVPYQAFTFLFKQTPHGLFRVHAYRYHQAGSTFIVECREDTWRAAGLDDADEDRTVAILVRRVRRGARRAPADQEPVDLAQLPDRALREVARGQRRAGRRRRAHRALLDRLGHQARDGGRDRAARRAARRHATSRPRSPRTRPAGGPRSRRCRPRRRRASSGSRAPSATCGWRRSQLTYSLMTRSLRV